MSNAKTLLELSGANMEPPLLKDACLVIIDIQNEYLEGPVAVSDANAAIASAKNILSKAREAGADIFHVAHKGKAGSLFDRDDTRGQIVDTLLPVGDEPTVEKGLPNAFAGTDLHTLLEKTGKKELVIIGMMTHMCVSSTARAALDLGYRVTIEAGACATRDLPDGKGGVVKAKTIHDVALVELSDRFAVITHGHDWQ